ncbi:MAG: P-loop NTPase [Thermaerobacter sp.]|nr:P-loop NTPase [Thermaerobacter sp.]
MPAWPTHPAFAAPPDRLGLTDGDRVELPEPQSPLHAQWLDQATAMRGTRPEAMQLKDAAKLERALRAQTGLLGSARTIGIYGAAGSGRTSVLLGLAAALRKVGETVAILDADLAAPSLRRRMDCTAAPLVVGGLVLPYIAQGMRLQGLDAFWPQPGPLPWQGRELGRVLERYREDVLWAQPDFLLIDLPPLGDPRLDEVAAFFDGERVLVQGALTTAVAGPPAAFTVRNAAQGPGDVAIPYVGAGDLSETLSTLFLPLASALGAKGSGSRS